MGEPCSLRFIIQLCRPDVQSVYRIKDVAWQCGKGTDFGMSDPEVRSPALLLEQWCLGEVSR